MEKRGIFESDELISRLHGDKVIWIIAFLLGMLSILLVYSSSSITASLHGTTNFTYLIKQSKFIIVGFAILYVCYKIPIGLYRLLAIPAMIACIAVLTLVLFKGSSTNDAKRWLEIGGSRSFQPTEFAKIAVVLYLARILEISKLETFKEFLIKIILPIGMVCGLLLVGSVSSALFIGCVSFIILYVAGVKISYLAKTIGIGSILVAVVIIAHLLFGIFPRMDTAINRLKKFVVKTEASEDMSISDRRALASETFQVDMAKVAVSSGGLLGKGPGNSTQRNVLPNSNSDYIFSIIIEEYGLLGAISVLMLYMWFLYRCVMLVKNCHKIFTAIVVGGFGLLITMQASLHILVNVGILPVTGHTLPLISSGGTSIIVVCCSIGIVLSVSRTIDMANISNKEKEEKEKEKAEKENNKETINTTEEAENNKIEMPEMIVEVDENNNNI
jgi:Bacterial cell division membrane protein